MWARRATRLDLSGHSPKKIGSLSRTTLRARRANSLNSMHSHNS